MAAQGLIPVRQYSSARELLETARLRKRAQEEAVARERARLWRLKQEEEERQRAQAEALASPRPPVEERPVPKHEYTHDIYAICDKWGITYKMFMGQNRTMPVALARAEACWLLLHKWGKSLSEIGRIIDKDHTTVLCAARKYEKWRLAKLTGNTSNVLRNQRAIPWDKIITEYA